MTKFLTIILFVIAATFTVLTIGNKVKADPVQKDIEYVQCVVVDKKVYTCVDIKDGTKVLDTSAFERKING